MTGMSDAEREAIVALLPVDPDAPFLLLDEIGRLLASRDARLAAVEALFVPDGDYAPCDQATWACPHTECEVAVAVHAALHSDPSEATTSDPDRIARHYCQTLRSMRPSPRVLAAIEAIEAEFPVQGEELSP